MSEKAESQESAAQARRLTEIIREVKNAAADRDDVVVELREASHTRLELMAAELAPFFAQVPADMDLFDFTISSGLQPRLWIDAISHVAMARDRRTYRFVKDTRAGRVVLAEDTAIKPVADQVARYVAERMIERERLMEGSAEPAIPGLNMREGEEETTIVRRGGWPAFLSGLGLVAAGALVGLIASVMALWDRLMTSFGSAP
ncbi:hypothetical protein [Mesorhizobium sp. YM1C-6-2]|jgi:hypothetical protein|uniref:hypothetical protein n=1 Tax=Mesorhizobium sp. YM1C-6-2 TaxID=1827501 RepID=UPI000EF20F72|nr:hypothetical protein [Mesorhizobium sp. YM1C-6-2]RLP26189.1 hypothetical protein D8676_10945 [Mesorhizobium sp. YM1C-6-2]